MSKWQEYKLGDIADITSSKRIFYSDYKESGIPFWRSKEVIEQFNRKSISTDLFISNQKYNEIKKKFGVPQKDDILLTSVGTLGIPYLVKNSDCFYFKDGNLTWIRNIDLSILSPKYLYMCLSSQLGREALSEITIGSTQEALTIVGIKSLALLIPPLPEQRAITKVLSSLDDKIDLLNRQNKTLEAMAETLFRQWFVEEADERWGNGKLPDEFEFVMGQSPEGSSLNEEGVGIPMFQGNADFGFRFPTERVFTTSPTRFAEPMDILISVRAPVGDQNMALKRCCIGRGVSAFRYKKDKSYYTYTFFKLRSLMSEIKQFNDEGTIFGSIGKKDFEGIDILIPPKPLIERFEITASPINNKIIQNSKQIDSLTKYRDVLLPKLMSGEVRVEV